MAPSTPAKRVEIRKPEKPVEEKDRRPGSKPGTVEDGVSRLPKEPINVGAGKSEYILKGPKAKNVEGIISDSHRQVSPTYRILGRSLETDARKARFFSTEKENSKKGLSEIREPKAEGTPPTPNATGHEIFNSLKVSAGEEVLKIGSLLPWLAPELGRVAAAEYLALPAAKTIVEKGEATEKILRWMAKKTLRWVAEQTAKHFKEGHLTDLGNPLHRAEALRQYVGFGLGELARKFPNSLDIEQARSILTEHFEKSSATTPEGRQIQLEELAKSLRDSARGDPEVEQFVLDGNNGWMFSEFTDMVMAQNRPGVYAGEAVELFAEFLAGSREGGLFLLGDLYSLVEYSLLEGKPERLQEQLENPEGELGLLVHFAARAANLGGFTSSVGLAYVLATEGLKEGNVKKFEEAVNIFNRDSMTSFDTMTENGDWKQVVKDFDQIYSYLHGKFGDNDFMDPPSL